MGVRMHQQTPVKASRSYSYRRFTNMLFVTIKQVWQTGKKVRSSEKTYTVQLAGSMEPGIHACYAKHEEDRAIYRVCYDPETDYRGCNCPAGQLGRTCCHSDNLAHLLQTGRLEGMTAE